MSLADFFSKNKVEPITTSKVVGIDIGSSSIKVVELQNINNVVTLTTYGEIQLGPYDDNKEIGQSVVLAPNIERQVLVDVLRESAVRAKIAVLAMPLSVSFVTTVTLSAKPKEDISSRVRVEAHKYIPIPMTEVTLDWAEIDTRAVVAETARDVLLAAIQNEALNRFQTLMQTVEFYNPPTEIECFSAIRSLYSMSDPSIAIIDIGATSTKLYLVHNGLLQRMYRVRAGGAHVTELIAKEMSLTFEEAEVLKRSISSEKEQFPLLQKINHNYYERVLKEFKQVIEEYEARTGIEITAVYLTGGGSLFPKTSNFVADSIGRPTSLVNPFNKVAYPAFMEDTMNEIGPTFAVALGAALQVFE
ncbi:hypothetical protein COY24_00970 [Candidatus Uhrbacteria bacterium CG_4_10_14_0_2_um_filter_41_21]|nr:MAG: hypothetical protein COY24_00970 [Candidatus Uhrbacteria bacterium CG_4_10_14_0_2_um_filter_41_21]